MLYGCMCRYLPLGEVAGVLNSSSIGGMFSATEGACYASTEYLMCGLPVVSTASTGGRDIWYPPHNSIIVEATDSAVAAGVQDALVKLQTGEFDRAEIRGVAAQMAEDFRAVFVRKIQVMDADRDGETGGQVHGKALLQHLRGVHKLGLM
jgi:glycosyltransferase involved in cell wall biosynthesis